MQKKILSAVLALCLVGSASAAFAEDGYYIRSLDVDVDVEINKAFDNDLIDVDNDSGNVLAQASNIQMGPGFGSNFNTGGPSGMGLPSQMNLGNVAAQANDDINGSLLAVGNSMSISFTDSLNTTSNLDINVAIDDSFNAHDSFNQVGHLGPRP